MQRWSFSGFWGMRDNFKPGFCFPAVKMGVNPGIRSWKSNYPHELDARKPLVVSISKKKWRAETLQPGLEFDNFELRLESVIFKCISWLNGSFFLGWWSGFCKRGSQDLANGFHVVSYLPSFLSVFTSVAYGWKTVWVANQIRSPTQSVLWSSILFRPLLSSTIP